MALHPLVHPFDDVAYKAFVLSAAGSQEVMRVTFIQLNRLVGACNLGNKVNAPLGSCRAVATRMGDKDRRAEGGRASHNSCAALQHFIPKTGTDWAAEEQGILALRFCGDVRGSAAARPACPRRPANGGQGSICSNGSSGGGGGGTKSLRLSGPGVVKVYSLHGHEWCECCEDGGKESQQWI
jgi:hypothetical protein